MQVFSPDLSFQYVKSYSEQFSFFKISDTNTVVCETLAGFWIFLEIFKNTISYLAKKIKA